MQNQTFQKLPEKILELPRPKKRAIAVTIDIILCVFCVALSYRLRLDAWIFPVGNQWLSYGIALALAIPLFIHFGLYRAIFRYVGWHAFAAVLYACAIFGVLYALIFSVIGFPSIPRTTGILQPILLFLAVGASRAVARFWLGGGYAAILGQSQRRHVLIYGAGSAGRQLAAGLASSREMQVVAFVDDNRALHGQFLNGKKVYAPEVLPKLIGELEIQDVLLAIPSTSRQRRNDIIESLGSQSVKVRTLPGIFELADGKVQVSDLQPLEIEDLLGRDPVPPFVELMSKCNTGKCVMVTGAGGSIGSELCRQILALNPKTLLLLEQSEYNLYALEHELKGKLSQFGLATAIVPIVGSVRDHDAMDLILRQWKPQTVYHAAAYKHVPLVEKNPGEAVRNNIFGTRTMASLSEKHGVRDFVLISTDKAVRPTNVMGATKRGAEIILQGLAAQSKSTCFSMVRFGNVLGSSGSVVPLFRQQIADGLPLTVTHPEVTRYFMTIPEAAQLVVQAGGMATGGEVFVLDMGSPVKIIDLAHKMIQLSGLRVLDAAHPDGDIEIRVVGLRPGEKLYEELLIGDSPEQTEHPRIMKANEKFLTAEQAKPLLERLNKLAEIRDEEGLRSSLRELVPEYLPSDSLE